VGFSGVSGSPKTSQEIRRQRALTLISLADKTTNMGEAAELLSLAAEQLELAESKLTVQQQQQVQKSDTP
jgi:hypothetical protein